jgi:2-phosphosulfolactate phosphatase
LLSHHTLKGKVVVVIDVMRATSSMITGLAEGVAGFLPVTELCEARSWQARGLLAAGERGGGKVDGFPLSNSPRQYLGRRYQGCEIVTTTSNGTRALKACAAAEAVWLGAFLNRTALAERLRADALPTLLVCSGWKQHFCLEDTLLAGALAESLAPEPTAQDDATLAARQLYRMAEGRLEETLRNSSHYQRLQSLGAAEDLPFCLEVDRYATLAHFDGAWVKAAC